MSKWALKIIPLNQLKTPEDYWKAMSDSYTLYFNTAKEAFSHLGFRLYRQRCGYAGHDKSHEYILGRIK